jgi:hypothetical protein
VPIPSASDVEQNVEIVSELQQAFQANSMPLLLPLMDLEEKQAISVKELLAPDAEKVLADANLRFK